MFHSIPFSSPGYFEVLLDLVNPARPALHIPKPTRKDGNSSENNFFLCDLFQSSGFDDADSAENAVATVEKKWSDSITIPLLLASLSRYKGAEDNIR